MARKKSSQEERTLVLVKPDGVMRGLGGEISSRFERRGLKIIGLKMVWPTAEHIEKHYPSHDEWYLSVGSRTSKFFKEYNMSLKDNLGTEDEIEIGKLVKKWLADYMTQSPVVAMVVEGMHAIAVVRKLTGPTYPVEAAPGTIRGDYSIDTPIAANSESRVVKNIVHASGNLVEAKHEIEHWFAPEEIHDYGRSDEDVMF